MIKTQTIEIVKFSGQSVPSSGCQKKLITCNKKNLALKLTLLKKLNIL